MVMIRFAFSQTASGANPNKEAVCSSAACRHAMAAPTGRATCWNAGAEDGLDLEVLIHDKPSITYFLTDATNIYVFHS